MKTSTKIFLTLAGLLVLAQVGFGINAFSQYKRIKPRAEKLARQIDETPIRVVDLDAGAVEPDEWRMKNMFSRAENSKFFQGGRDMMEKSFISGDTLYIKGYERDGKSWPLYNGLGLEAVVVHVDGKPDRVIDIPREVPLPEK